MNGSPDKTSGNLTNLPIQSEHCSSSAIGDSQALEPSTNSSHALTLYETARNLVQATETLDFETARLIVETCDDAINELGHTSQDKKIELRRWRAEAMATLPPRTIKELKERAEEQLLAKGYPKQKSLRALVLLIVSFVMFILGTAGAYKTLWSPKVKSNFTTYQGYITDAENGKPLAEARVTIQEDQDVPQITSTDSKGMFHVIFRGSKTSGRIRVELAGYDSIDRVVSFTSTHPEEIHLLPIKDSKAPSIQVKSRSNEPTSAKTKTHRKPKAKLSDKTAEQRAYEHLDYRKP